MHFRLRVVPHFSSGIGERAKRERALKSPHARKGDMRRGERKMILSPCCVSPLLAWGDFHARSRFACSTIPEEKWGTTRSQGAFAIVFDQFKCNLYTSSSADIYGWGENMNQGSMDQFHGPGPWTLFFKKWEMNKNRNSAKIRFDKKLSTDARNCLQIFSCAYMMYTLLANVQSEDC